jgi:flagellar motor protein MotB
LALAFAGGCADNPMVLKSQVDSYKTQQQNLVKQNETYKSRIDALDRDNQQKEALLAQTQQQTKVLEDKLAAMREQLSSTTSQLTQVQAEKANVDRNAQVVSAQLRRQSGISITPNSSFLQALPVIHRPDVHVRRDGDVIRVELPGSQLFDPGSARLRAGGDSIIVEAATEIRRNYPDQILGVEGHTDNDPVSSGPYHSNHELSVARAVAVCDVLVGSGRYRADQVFIAGHGPNHPIVSNATLEGKLRNRRIELVIYPEKYKQ